jgi:hypothetical protein
LSSQKRFSNTQKLLNGLHLTLAAGKHVPKQLKKRKRVFYHLREAFLLVHSLIACQKR